MNHSPKKLKKEIQANHYTMKGVLKFQKQDYFDALTCFSKVTILILILQAVSQYRLKELSPELKSSDVLTYDSLVECYLCSAYCYIKIQQADQALNLINQIQKVEPLSMEAQFLLVRVRYEQKKFESLEQEMAKLKRLITQQSKSTLKLKKMRSVDEAVTCHTP